MLLTVSLLICLAVGFWSGWRAAEIRYRPRRLPLVVGEHRVPLVMCQPSPRSPFARDAREWN